MEITVTAKTYDDAITEALIELQTTSDKLVVTVVEEGKEGLLGVIGNKPWVIKARVRKDGEVIEEEPETKYGKSRRNIRYGSKYCWTTRA